QVFQSACEGRHPSDVPGCYLADAGLTVGRGAGRAERSEVQALQDRRQLLLLRRQLRLQRIGGLKARCHAGLQLADPVIQIADRALDPLVGRFEAVLLQFDQPGSWIGDLGELVRQRAETSSRGAEEIERRSDLAVGERAEYVRVEGELAVDASLDP